MFRWQNMAIKKIFYFCFEKILSVLSFLSLVIVLLLHYANPFFYLPNRDNGYYLYGGRFILNGGLLYKKLWEERPPAMYYLNALGIWLGRDSRWGVWLIELVFLTLAAWIGYGLIKKLWQPGAAVFGTLMWIWGLSRIMVTGNLIEEYPILFGFLALAFFILSIEHPNRRIYDVLIGVFAALSFLFRANTMGAEVAIGLSWLAWGIITRHKLDAIKRLAFIALGAFIPIILVILYFWYLGTLYEMVVASVLYGLFYTSEHSNLISSIIGGFGYVGFPAWVTLAGWGVSVAALLVGLKDKKVTPLALLLVLIWPVEVGFSGLSARAYEHYFVSWGPAMAMTCGYLYYQISQFKVAARFNPLINRYASFILVGITVVILFLNRATVLEYRRPLLNLMGGETSGYEKIDRVAQYIDTFTDPKDQVLAWGGQAAINYTSHRDTPTAAAWYPTYVVSPFTSKINDQFLDDIKRQSPELIVDAYIDSPLDVPSINDETRKRQENAGIYLLTQSAETPNLPQVLAFIRANYDFETTVDQHDIYRLKDSKWKGKVPPPFTW
jgi:hypothetical protein